MAARAAETALVSMVCKALSTLLSIPAETIEVRANPGVGADLLLSAAGQTFSVEVKGASSAGSVAIHAEHAAGAAKAAGRRVIPVVAVPYMGPAGRQACERAGVSWFDFSGNARIVAPGLRIIVDGRPNQFRRRGRPPSVFAPKSSRVARWLLMHPGVARSQRDIARATGVSKGLVSRIVSRLEEERYVARGESGSLRVIKPQLLLEAWQEEYRFSRHTIIKGHVAARSGDALTRFVGDTLTAAAVEHAATGLAGAWLLTHFAGFRTTTFYVSGQPTASIKHELGFREDDRGANLWLVIPNDVGVFQGVEEGDGIRCVHPVQVYLDLREHPERASEAAERVRAQFLSW